MKDHNVTQNSARCIKRSAQFFFVTQVNFLNFSEMELTMLGKYKDDFCVTTLEAYISAHGIGRHVRKITAKGSDIAVAATTTKPTTQQERAALRPFLACCHADPPTTTSLGFQLRCDSTSAPLSRAARHVILQHAYIGEPDFAQQLLSEFLTSSSSPRIRFPAAPSPRPSLLLYIDAILPASAHLASHPGARYISREAILARACRPPPPPPSVNGCAAPSVPAPARRTDGLRDRREGGGGGD
jgi:hypothetical protein